MHERVALFDMIVRDGLLQIAYSPGGNHGICQRRFEFGSLLRAKNFGQFVA